MTMQLVFKCSNGNIKTGLLSDRQALSILQAQYGRDIGAEFLSCLLSGKSQCATITATKCAIGDGAIYAESTR